MPPLLRSPSSASSGSSAARAAAASLLVGSPAFGAGAAVSRPSSGHVNSRSTSKRSASLSILLGTPAGLCSAGDCTANLQGTEVVVSLASPSPLATSSFVPDAGFTSARRTADAFVILGGSEVPAAMASRGPGASAEGSAASMLRAALGVGPTGGSFEALVLELQLRIALMLGWHDACSLWSVLQPALGAAGRLAWRELVSAIVAHRGHDEAFLADLSMLRDASRYRPLIGAYAELHPGVVKKAFGHRYSPNRMLGHIFASDDIALLQLILETNRQVTVEATALCAAIEQRADRCVGLLLAEASSDRANSGGSRVRIEYPRSSLTDPVGQDRVNFSNYPQRLLWAAAQTRSRPLCDGVMTLLRERCRVGSSITCGSGGSASPWQADAKGLDKLQLWAACCGAACGDVPLLECCDPAALAGPLARVSFHAPGSVEVDFAETPLAAVAAARGHIGALEALAQSGADLQLCCPRGFSAEEAARKQRVPALRERLLATLHAAGIARASTTSGPFTVGRARASGAEPETGSPLSAAVERGDLPAVRHMLRHGARLQAEDIMAAVRSGDLDVLAFVQKECAASASGQDEYRKMMHKTATQIRENSKSRLRASTGGSTSSSSLRQAGASVMLRKSSVLP